MASRTCSNERHWRALASSPRRLRWCDDSCSCCVPVLALSAALLGESVLARQGEAEDSLPGVVSRDAGTECRRRRRAATSWCCCESRSSRERAFRRAMNPAPPWSSSKRGASASRSNLRRVEANLTLAGGNGTVPLPPGAETILAPGDAVSAGEGARLALRNAGDGEAMLLYAAVAGAGDSLFAASCPGCLRDVQRRDLRLSGGDDPGHAGNGRM